MDKVLLEDVCYILDNKRVPITECDRKKGPYPYYGANGVQDYVDDYIFDDELVLLAEDGGNFGSKEKPIAYRVSGKCWVNNHAHVLKPKENINVNYLCYSLMFYDVSGFVNGATRQKLTQSNMRQMLIPFCSLAEQQRIANEFDKVSGLIEKRQKQLEKLDLLIKSRFVEMFGDLDCAKYNLSTIVEICDFVKDGTHQTPIYTDDKENGYKFLSSKDVTSGYIDWEHLKYIPKDLHCELYSRIAPRKGDILLAKNGTTGVCAVVDKEEIFDIYVSLAILRPKAGINSVFLWGAINMPFTKKQFDASLKGIGVPNLHLGEIKKTKLIVPPIELQNQFADFVEKVEQNKSKIKNSLDKLITLKKSLMQKYFG